MEIKCVSVRDREKVKKNQEKEEKFDGRGEYFHKNVVVET